MTLDHINPSLCCPCRGVPVNLVIGGPVYCKNCLEAQRVATVNEPDNRMRDGVAGDCVDVGVFGA